MEATSTLVEEACRRMALMQRMIARLDADRSRVVCADKGITCRAMVGRCRGCGEAAQGGGTNPARLCPNAKIFRTFRHQ